MLGPSRERWKKKGQSIAIDSQSLPRLEFGHASSIAYSGLLMLGRLLLCYSRVSIVRDGPIANVLLAWR